MRLIIARHGETVENSIRVVQGQLPGALSGRGIRQAEAAGSTLKGYRIDAAYSSDLARAWETARIISAFHPGLTVVVEPRLREQHLGRFQGGPVSALMRRIKGDRVGITSFDPEDGEPSAEFRTRVESVVRDISSAHPDGTVLVVTHHGVIRMLMDVFAPSVTPERMSRMSGNGALTIVTLDGMELHDMRSIDDYR